MDFVKPFIPFPQKFSRLIEKLNGKSIKKEWQYPPKCFIMGKVRILVANLPGIWPVSIMVMRHKHEGGSHETFTEPIRLYGGGNR